MKKIFYSLVLTTIFASQLDAMWLSLARTAARNMSRRSISAFNHLMAARPLTTHSGFSGSRAVTTLQTSLLTRYAESQKSLVHNPSFRSHWDQSRHYSNSAQSQELVKKQDSYWHPLLLCGGLVAFLGANSDDKKSSAEEQKQHFPPSRVLQALAEGKELNPAEKRAQFTKDCAALKTENNNIPQKNFSTVRVATYNVHFWTSPDHRHNFDAIFDVIKTIDADIVILEEVVLGPTKHNNFLSKEQLYQKLQNLGYNVQCDTFGRTEKWGKADFGNIILSRHGYEAVTKKTYQHNCKKKHEKRCYVNTKIKLPNNKIISVYGTHLDVFDTSGKTRHMQVKELLSAINNDKSENIIIAGDFNEIKQEDYHYLVDGKPAWELIKQENLKRNDPTPTAALDLLAWHNFKDCFRKSGQQTPKFTVWSGTVVDYILLNRTWNLPIQGCYVYYSAASDHMPVLMDIKMVQK